jgi:ribose transport system ATP-binding protein
MSHRVLVMRDGRVTDTLDASPGLKPTPLAILERMI